MFTIVNPTRRIAGRAGMRIRARGMLATLAAMALGATIACRSVPHSRAAAAADGDVLALVGGTIYPAPDASPITDGVLIIDGGQIRAVGPRARTPIPAGATVMDLRGRTVLPGFWNSHVHFIEPKWTGIDSMPADRASDLLREMFTRFGFVHVVDIGSFPEVTPALRRRVRAGEVLGPDILTTLVPFVPPNGTPRYLAPLRLPELGDAAGARDSIRARLAQGADAIKLFAVSLTRTRPFPAMSPAVVEAATDEAHRAGKRVFAHPTDLAGVQLAVAGGVDILAHTAPMAGTLPDSLLRSMQRRGVALISTLTLFEDDYGPDTVGMGAFMRVGQGQVRAYTERGGRILFGTDVGYIAHYDPTREYELLAGAGLSFRDILTSLTAAPADEFGRGDRAGRLAPGFAADVVAIDGDPAQDIRALARVRLTMKQGRILYDAAADTQR